MQGTLGCWEDRGTAKLQAPAGRPPLRPILVRRVLCGLHGVVLGPVLRWLLFSLGTGCRERTHSANGGAGHAGGRRGLAGIDRKSTRLNSSHLVISYAVFCLKKKKKNYSDA